MWRFLQNTRRDAELSRDDFRQACEIDPAFASGHSGCALSYLSEAIFHGTLAFFDAGILAEVEARKAVAIDPNDSDANAALSHALFNVGNFDAAQEYASRAVALNHHSVWAHTANATVQVFSGRYTEGRNAALASLRLNPHHPTSPLMPTAIIASLYWEGSYDAVLKGARRCLSEYPAFAPARRYVVASLGQLGRIAEAEAELQQFVAIAPKVFRAVVYNRPSFLQRAQQEDCSKDFGKQAGNLKHRELPRRLKARRFLSEAELPGQGQHPGVMSAFAETPMASGDRDLAMSAAMGTDPTLVRLGFLAQGYRPVPVLRHDSQLKDAGKRPVLFQWQEVCARADEAEIRKWARDLECSNTRHALWPHHRPGRGYAIERAG